MSMSVDNFVKIVNCYNTVLTLSSAICVRKGGLSIDDYVGRFFIADVLEFIVEYGRELEKQQKLSQEIVGVVKRLEKNFDRVKGLVTPSKKPIYKMTLEEFEKMMNL